MKSYTYQQRGKKRKKRKKLRVKIRTGPDDGCRALKLHSLTGHFKKTNTLQYHFLIQKS